VQAFLAHQPVHLAIGHVHAVPAQPVRHLAPPIEPFPRRPPGPLTGSTTRPRHDRVSQRSRRRRDPGLAVGTV
jgi:hypothetical protein